MQLTMKLEDLVPRALLVSGTIVTDHEERLDWTDALITASQRKPVIAMRLTDALSRPRGLLVPRLAGQNEPTPGFLLDRHTSIQTGVRPMLLAFGRLVIWTWYGCSRRSTPGVTGCRESATGRGTGRGPCRDSPDRQDDAFEGVVNLNQVWKT